MEYTQVRICTRGWLSFNLTGNSSTNEFLFNSSVPNNTIAPWWDNLDASASLSFVSYNTTGSTPNRVFTVEWHRAKTYVGASARVTFQVKLFESSNVIEFHYGTPNGGSHSSFEGASIGIEDATGGTNHFIEATTGSTTTGVTNLVSPGNWPAVNYRFTPPVATENFNNLKISKSGNQVSFNCNANVAGSLTVNTGATLKITFPRTIAVNGY